MSTFDKGAWGWLPDETECYVPVQATAPFKAGSPGSVTREGAAGAGAGAGAPMELSAEQTASLLPMDEQSLATLPNMVDFNELNEAVLLHNLRKRFVVDEIYSSVGTILVAVNPFKLLPLYTPEVLQAYVSAGGADEAGLAPHCWAVAVRAYRALANDYSNQAVCISGESGAGKTESMKLILQALASVSSKASGLRAPDGGANGGGGGGGGGGGADPEQKSIEQLILSTNPVTEAFGNAKTLRNNNSSRFGKWTSLSFSKSGCITGGSITSYLLEKSRVVFQAKGERSYHAFYQLLAGAAADSRLRAELALEGGAASFRYVVAGETIDAPGVDDSADFGAMMDALHNLGLDMGRQQAVLRVIGAVLHLGNVTFVPISEMEEGAAVSAEGTDELDEVVRLLGVDAEALTSALTSKNIGSRSIILVPFTLEQAENARDALAKALYGKLFDFLIGQICTSLSAGMAGATPEIKVKKARRASLVGMDMAAATTAAAAPSAVEAQGAIIGVLDIFGFEFFETNSFEQLCINYTNEKLQFHFNDFIFTLEQAEYVAEGLDVSQVSFASNEPTLALIEAPAGGLLAMLDEEVVVPKGSDEGFLNKVLQRHGASKELARPKAKALNSRLCFGVVHFAGEVQYNVTAFLEKNRDSLLPGLESVCGGASDSFTAALFKKDEPAEAAAGGGGAPGRRPLRRGKKKVKTLAAGFKLQMSQLMGALGSCQPHFIRCMKPNSQKVGGLFDAPLMMGQLRCAGVLEVCRIRQVGYPSRRPFAQFEHRYGALAKVAGVGAAAGGTSGTAASATALCERLVAQGALGKEPAAGEGGGGGWAVGKTKVFLRANAQTALDLARDAVLESFVVRLQCGSRRYIARKRHVARVAALRSIDAACAARDADALRAALGLVAAGGESGLPGGGAHLEPMKRARRLLDRIGEAARLADALKAAVSAGEVGSLKAWVATAKKFDDEGAASDGRLFEELHAALLAEAASACDRAAKQAAAKAGLVAAAAKHPPIKAELEEALYEAAVCGLDSAGAPADGVNAAGGSPEYEVARSLLDRLEEEAAVLEELGEALAARELKTLNALLTSIIDLGMDKNLSEEQKELVAQAKYAQAELKVSQSVRYALRKAVALAEETREPPTLVDAIATAEKAGIADDETGTAELEHAQLVLAALRQEADATGALSAAIASRSDAALRAALELAAAAKLSGGLELVAEAKAVLSRVGKEATALAALREAVGAATVDMKALDMAVEAATSLWGDGKDGAAGGGSGNAEVAALLEKARAAQAAKGGRAAALRGLLSATAAAEAAGRGAGAGGALGKLEAALEAAKAAGISPERDPTAQRGAALCKKLNDQAYAEADLRAAVSGATASNEACARIEAAIDACAAQDLNERTSPAVSAAKTALGALTRKMTMMVSPTAVLDQLKLAVMVRDADAIALGIMGALRKGVSADDPTMVAARELAATLQAMQLALVDLQRAMELRSGEQIEAALKAVTAAGGAASAGGEAEVDAAEAMLVAARSLAARLNDGANVTDGLRAAIGARDQGMLAAALETAAALGGMTTANNYTFRQAHALVGQLFIEREFSRGLEGALEAEDLHTLNALLVKAQTLGLEKEPKVRRARDLAAQLQRRQRAAVKVAAALASQQPALLKEALEAALEAGLEHTEEVRQLRVLVGGGDRISDLLAQLRAAAESRDLTALDRLLVQARAVKQSASTYEGGGGGGGGGEDDDGDDDMGVEIRDDVVTEALVLRERLMLERRTEQALLSATSAVERAEKGEGDGRAALAELMESIADAMQANVGGEPLYRAQEVATSAGARVDQVELLNAALIAADLAMQRADGATERDGEGLQLAIDVARESGQCELECDEAEDSLSELRRTLAVSEDLLAAFEMAGTDPFKPRALRAALVVAGELAMETNLVVRATAELRDLHAAEQAAAETRRSSTGNFAEDGTELRRARSVGEAEEEWARKMAAAESNPAAHHFSKFDRIRVGADFALGAAGGVQMRREVARKQLMWQSEPLHKSLTYLDGDGGALNAAAKHMHADILGFCGDVLMSFPHTLAHHLLSRGHGDARLRDEILLQIMKQLTGAPSPKSTLRAWQLLGFCLHCFAPSPAFERHVLHFLLSHRCEPEPVGPLVAFALEKMRVALARGTPIPMVPSVDALDGLLPKAVHRAVRRGSLLVRQRRVEAYLIQEEVKSAVDAVGAERAEALQQELLEARAVYSALLRREQAAADAKGDGAIVRTLSIGGVTGSDGVKRMIAESDVSVEALSSLWALAAAEVEAEDLAAGKHVSAAELEAARHAGGGVPTLGFSGFCRFLAACEAEYGEPLKAVAAHAATSSVSRADTLALLKGSLLGSLRATLTHHARALGPDACGLPAHRAAELGPAAAPSTRDAGALRRGLQRAALAKSLAKRQRRASLERTGILKGGIGAMSNDPRAQRMERRMQRMNLGRALQRRPSRADVAAMGILREGATIESDEAERAATGASLGAKLARRPSRVDVEAMGILAHGGKTGAQVTAERGVLRSALHRKLSTRPDACQMQRLGLFGGGAAPAAEAAGLGGDPAAAAASAGEGERDRISKQLSEALVSRGARRMDSGILEKDALAVLFKELAGATELLTLEQLRGWDDVAAQLAEGELYEGELRGCFHAVDVDADGQITFSEFLCMLDLLEEAKEKEAAAGGAARSAGSATAVASAASVADDGAPKPKATRRSSLVKGRRQSSLRVLGAHRGQTESLKDVLVGKLRNRATLEQVQAKGVWKNPGVSPAAALLERNLLANQLKGQLKRRSSKMDLVAQGIYVEQSGKQQQAQRNLQKMVLTRQLGLRPERERLESAGIYRDATGASESAERKENAAELGRKLSTRPDVATVEKAGILKRGADPIKIELEKSVIAGQLNRALQRRPSRVALEATGLFDEVDELATLFGAICDEGEEMTFGELCSWDAVKAQLEGGDLADRQLREAWAASVGMTEESKRLFLEAGAAQESMLGQAAAAVSSFFGGGGGGGGADKAAAAAEASAADVMNFSQFLTFLDCIEEVQQAKGEDGAAGGGSGALLVAELEESAAEQLRKRRLFRSQRKKKAAGQEQETLKASLITKIRARPDLQALRKQNPSLFKGDEAHAPQTAAQAMLERNLISANLKHALARRSDREQLQQRGVIKANGVGSAAGVGGSASDASSLSAAGSATGGVGRLGTGDMSHLLNRANLNKGLNRRGRPSLVDLEAQGIYKPHLGGAAGASRELESNMQRAMLGRKLSCRPELGELQQRGIHKGAGASGSAAADAMRSKIAAGNLSRALDPTRRSSIADLEQAGILKPHAPNPAAAAAETKLARGLLNRKLSIRPDQAELLSRGILHDSGTAGAQGDGAGELASLGNLGGARLAAAQALEKQMMQDNLGRRLSIRPDVDALVARGILAGGSAVGGRQDRADLEAAEAEKTVLAAQLNRAMANRPSADALQKRGVLGVGGGRGGAGGGAMTGGGGNALALERQMISDQLAKALKQRPSKAEVAADKKGIFASEALALGFAHAADEASELATLEQLRAIPEIGALLAEGKVEEPELRTFFSALDADKDGALNFSQFLQLMDELSAVVEEMEAAMGAKATRKASLASSLAEAMAQRPELAELKARGLHKGGSSASAMLERNLLVNQLKANLGARPDKSMLTAKGILLQGGAGAEAEGLGIAGDAGATGGGGAAGMRAQRKNSAALLQANLGKRPDLASLKQRGIFSETTAASKSLERGLLANALKNQLMSRPDRSELEGRGIVQDHSAETDYVLLLDEVLSVAVTLRCTSAELKQVANVPLGE